VSWDFIQAWTQSPDQDVTQDKRGWPKGKLRTYNQRYVKRIIQTHQRLVHDPKAFFIGATAILQEWREHYPQTEPPSACFIGRVLKTAGLSRKLQRGRHKGASKALHYPADSIKQLGERLLEIDFIGKKFLHGRTEPLNFIGFSLTQPRKAKYFQRITGETAENVIAASKQFFTQFETPDVVKMDNAFATAGSGSAKRTLSNVVMFYLKHQILPVFAPPRKPWAQGSIEGANSVFARKFWNRFTFQTTREVDSRLADFNASYESYTGYHPPQRTSRRKRNFIPKVYFIRKVYEDTTTGTGYIEVANETVQLPQAYINFFTFAEWNLRYETLSVYFENEHKLKLIKKISFKIHPKSKEKVSDFI
jgi:hypothetical protein